MILERDGYTILETNWRYQKAEIDIIAKKDEFLVLVEVKTRSSKKYGKPEESINKKKISLYQDAAENYIETLDLNLEIRFDVISIVIGKDKTDIEHIPNAF